MTRPGSPPTDVLGASTTPRVALKLVVVEGPDHGAELLLEQGTYQVGKDDSCDLVVHDGAVSRSHLSVSALSDGVRVTDNGSTNGSFCEGMRFTTLEVKAGASITIGRTVMKIVPQQARGTRLKPSEKSRFGALTGGTLPMRE